MFLFQLKCSKLVDTKGVIAIATKWTSDRKLITQTAIAAQLNSVAKSELIRGSFERSKSSTAIYSSKWCTFRELNELAKSGSFGNEDLQYAKKFLDGKICIFLVNFLSSYSVQCQFFQLFRVSLFYKVMSV